MASANRSEPTAAPLAGSAPTQTSAPAAEPSVERTAQQNLPPAFGLAPAEVAADAEPRGGPLPTRPLNEPLVEELAALPTAEEEPESRQFSLSGLLWLTALAALLLWPARWLSRPIYALLIGLCCTALLLAAQIWRSDLGLIRVGWWLLLLFYLAISLMAIMGW